MQTEPNNAPGAKGKDNRQKLVDLMDGQTIAKGGAEDGTSPDRRESGDENLILPLSKKK